MTRCPNIVIYRYFLSVFDFFRFLPVVVFSRFIARCGFFRFLPVVVLVLDVAVQRLYVVDNNQNTNAAKTGAIVEISITPK